MPIIDKKLPNGKSVKWDTDARGAVAEFEGAHPGDKDAAAPKQPKKPTRPKPEPSA